MGLNPNVFSDSPFEPLFGIASIVVAAGPVLTEGASVSAFVDDVGQSAAGGIAVKDGDTNLAGGIIPQGMGFELFDLTVWMHLSDHSAVIAEEYARAGISGFALTLQSEVVAP